jgi:ribonucleoside-triphosphate reductase
MIIKKDGSREEFDKEKLKRSCLNAGAAPDVAERISNKIEELAHNEITTEELRVLVLSMLRKSDSSCVDKWLDYEKNK